MDTDSERMNLVDRAALPANYPTHLHAPAFWEALGRTVATYGFLEQTLGRAIFALTGTREYAEEEIDAAYDKWGTRLERAISDSMGGLIDLYGKALREHGKVKLNNPEALIEDLRAAARLRNVLCHGSWEAPDAEGKSLPFFVTPKMQRFISPVDIAFLKQTRAHVVELIAEVINSVTSMGWQFPGSGGPGESILG